MSSPSSTKSIFYKSEAKFRLPDHKFKRFILLNLHFISPILVLFIFILVFIVLIFKNHGLLNGLYSEDQEIINFISTTLSCNGICLVISSALAYFFNSNLIKIIPQDEFDKMISKLLTNIEATSPTSPYDKEVFKDKSIEDYEKVRSYSDNVVRPRHRGTYSCQLFFIYLSVVVISLDVFNLIPSWELLLLIIIFYLKVTILILLGIHFFIAHLTL